MKKNLLNYLSKSGLAAILLFSSNFALAQLKPLGASYFQNQYLNNPAFAGIQEGLNVNLSYRKQTSSIPGSPETEVLSSDYGFGKNAGLGLNVFNDKAGLQIRTRVMASYAYHLPLNSEGAKLNFGVSVGFSNDRLDMEKLNGNSGDVAVGQYNQRDTYLDGDFGAAYTSDKLTIQGAIPNLKSFFKKDDEKGTVDRATFFAAASYKLMLTEGYNGINIEPKVSFRGVKGLDNIADIGSSINFIDNKLQFFGMYHTSKSASFGMGVQYKAINITGMYTTETAALRGYTAGDFEIGVRFHAF